MTDQKTFGPSQRGDRAETDRQRRPHGRFPVSDKDRAGGERTENELPASLCTAYTAPCPPSPGQFALGSRRAHSSSGSHPRIAGPEMPRMARFSALLLTFALSLPALALSASAQLPGADPAPPVQEVPRSGGTFLVGVRTGTLGVGLDAGFGLGETIALRGGVGFLGFGWDVTGRFGLEDNRTAVLDLVDALYTLGVEASLGFARVGAGMLVKSGDLVHTITYGDGARIEIGGNPYTQPGVLTIATTIESGAGAPYATLGFGSRRSRGISFSADIGAAFLRNADVAMVATGAADVLGSAAFKADLEAERRETKDDIGRILDFWPIFSVALSYGF